jgi:ABC-type nitrate/sulfonate/bicarbonate transport system substrate-binding protein
VVDVARNVAKNPRFRPASPCGREKNEKGGDLMTSLTGRILAVSGLALGVAFSFQEYAADQKGEPLVISYVTTNATHWDIDVAIDKGFLAKEGFAPEVVSFHSSPQAVQLIISGAANMASIEPESLVSAVLHGATDIGAIAQQESKPDWMLIVRPEIKSWSDLKGKRLGFSALTTAEIWLTQQLLAKHGLKKDEWTGIQVGISPAKFAALKKGSISGSVLFQPLALKAVETGMRSMAEFAEVGNYPPTLIPVRRSWAAKDNNGVRLGRAIQHANQWLYDPKNRDEALKILETHTKASPEIAQELYKMYFVTDKVYSPDAAVSLAGLKRVTGVMTALGHIPEGKAPKPEDLVIAKKDGGLWH